MVEENKKNSFSTETGSLKFGAGSLQVINNQDCWIVPGLGIYDSLGKFIGDTIEEAGQTIETQRAHGESDEKSKESSDK